MSTRAIKNIMLIDDDADDYIIFKGAVHEVDPSVELRYVSGVKDLPPPGSCTLPDLLFLDINMPEHDGFEWLHGIRSRGYTIPVIMYSTASNPVYVEKAYASGANIYFTKPSSIRTLERSLAYLLQLDWSDPAKITAQFCSNGTYRVFRLD